MSTVSIPAIILGVVVGVAALAAAIFLLFKLFGLVWVLLGNVFRFIGAEVSDALRLVGSVLASVVFSALVVLNIVIGRWSASGHFARAFKSECQSVGRSAYRLVIGNPARLFGLGRALEGIEQRVPAAMAEAPGRDTPSKKRIGMFEGYTIVGSLPGGGSGGRLYIAEPDDVKRAVLERRLGHEIDQVVIKAFSLKDGSSLPQIVRESNCLDPAKKLGLVLEHELNDERFFYVMRYVPGESLSQVTQRMHASSAGNGLDADHLRSAMSYIADLLHTLSTYHRGGLWHKDVKPDNIIVDGRGDQGRAHLVDFGLVTPLRSAMTLTTHGTEYFRDPELVRQALRGVKVHQIDGAKFDVYAAGAVLYSVIENSFPAHGGLSQVSRRCPESLRWIIRRSMAEYDRRYPTAHAMLADLEFLRGANDPFAVKPAELPSMKQGDAEAVNFVEPEPVDPIPASFAAAATPVPPPPPPAEPAPPGERARPRIRVAHWWSGRYDHGPARPAAPLQPALRPPAPPRREGFASREEIRASMLKQRPRARVPRAKAHEQLHNARERARATRERARARISQRRQRVRKSMDRFENKPNRIALGAVGFFFMFVAAAAVMVLVSHRSHRPVRVAPSAPAHAIAHTEEGVISIDIGADGRGMTASVGGMEWGTGDDWGDDWDRVVADLPRVHERVLVVSELRAPMDQRVADEFRAGLELWRQAGAEVFGELPVEEPLDDATQNLLGSARYAVRQVPSYADGFAAKLRRFLGDHGQVGLVLWIGPDAERPDAVRFLLIGPEFQQSVVTGTDELAESLVRTLRDFDESL